VGDIGAYAFGTTSCNIGDANLPWVAASNKHPVIASHAYRLKNGRFEQIGMSWVKHGWGALTLNYCCTCINPNNFEALGVGCSDPYDAGLNGDQGGIINNGDMVSGLGPRSQIKVATGTFPWPYATIGQTGDAIYKRLQIHQADLDPALNPGALYFAECHYVSGADIGSGNGLNSASYRPFTVGTFSSGSWGLTLTGETVQQEPALFAWRDVDGTVAITQADVPGDGHYMMGCKVSDNGNGTWRYEYALYNMTSYRAVRSVRVPVPPGATVTNIGFHDVDYHSGDGFVIGTSFDGTDWPSVFADGAVTWSTSTIAANPNANALRWGTTYNFRFDSNLPPGPRDAALTLFRLGTPASITIGLSAPAQPGDVNFDGLTDIDDLFGVINAWGEGGCPNPCAADLNHDGNVDVDDLFLVINNWT
jgi:hypothetical protein